MTPPRLPYRAAPAAFLLCIALIALAGFHRRLRFFRSVLLQGSADIIAFLDPSLRIAPDITAVAFIWRDQRPFAGARFLCA